MQVRDSPIHVFDTPLDGAAAELAIEALSSADAALAKARRAVAA
jgi:hypothetical protein